MVQTRFYAFGWFRLGVSSRRKPIGQYAFDDWRDTLDTAIDELKNDHPELAKSLAGMYDVSPHNWSGEGGDGFRYFVEEVSQEQFRRIEGLDPEYSVAEREQDEYFAGKYDHRPYPYNEEW